MTRRNGNDHPKPPRVLVIGGDVHNTALLREILGPLHVEFEAAATGRMGLRLALENPPDLILMEIVLPDVNGIDLCAHFKSQVRLRDTPVLFATGVEDTHAQAEALDAVGAGLLLKPLRQMLVRAAVKNALLLKEALDANRRLLEQRRSLATMLVHDMRNLIQANQGFAKLALMEGVPPGIADSLRLIDQTAEELRFLVNGLLDVERLEAASLPVRRERLPLVEAARQRAELAGHNIRRVQVSVVSPKEGDDPMIEGDPGLLNRLFENLLFNAVKFSPDEGNVSLSFRRVPEGWETRVENDGPPIPAEFHEKIFEKFGQLNPEEGETRGVGLGLAFCRMAVRAMGGAIRVESPLPGRGDGVSFSFVLPAAGEGDA
jgi:signal transduction histidine kinase